MFSTSQRGFWLRIVLLATNMVSGPLLAQTFPSKPVEIVVAQSPGSGADSIVRFLGPKLTSIWGQPVVVENKPGANGIVGLQYLSRLPADGHGLALAAPSPMTVNQFIYKKMTLRPLDDFVPITQMTAIAFALVVNQSFPAKSISDLVSLAKQKEGGLNYSSAGVGNLGHLAAELFSIKAGIKMHHIPNKGDGPALLDVVSGNTQLMFLPLPGAIALIKSGKLRLLAVAGKSRLAAYPDVPTIAESGYPDVVIEGWSGIVAPGGTPDPVVQTIQNGFTRILAEPDMREYFAIRGQSVVASSPEEFGAFMRSEADKWSKVVSAIGLQID